MAIRFAIMIFAAVIPIGRWSVVIPEDEVNALQVGRLKKGLEDAERVVEYCLDLPLAGKHILRVAPTSGDFASWTGRSIWEAAAVCEGELVVQPLSVLEKRGVLEETLMHECVHLALLPYRLPRWLNEGLAVLCSGQAQNLSEGFDREDLTEDRETIESLLSSIDTFKLRLGYLSAARLAQEIINEIGRDSLVRLIKEEAL